MEALLIWTIQTKQADKMVDGPTCGGDGQRSFSLTGPQSDLMGVARTAALGCRPDSSSVMQRYHLDPDAERTYHACGRLLHAGELGLVIGCARTASRPDWHPELAPLQWRPAELVVDARTSCLRPLIKVVGGQRYVPVVVDDNRDRIERWRSVYRDWWDALDRLRRHLTGTLHHWELNGVGAHREPWALNGWAEKKA